MGICWAVLMLLLCLFAPALHAALPDFDRVKAGWTSSEARLLDRHGRLLQEIRVDGQLRRTEWTPLSEVSPAFIAALLRAEDRRFFEHTGVDWLAAGKAALTNWLAEKPRGASTLTMQLVALLDEQYRGKGKRRDVAEKWDQMGAARELEKSWRKADILEAYLNLASFRGELVGIDAAARGLFDKRPAGLSNEESLILAALIRSPNAKPDQVAKRACALAADLPGGPACAALRTRTLNTLSGRYPIVPAAEWAPHRARRLIQNNVPTPHASTTLFPPFGKGGSGGISQPPPSANPLNPPRPPFSKEGSAMAHLSQKGSLTTTLDADLQRFALATLKEQLARLAPRNVQDAAVLVADNASGEVLAYASLGMPESTSPHSDGVQAPRQAGSTLKPFLYGLALEKRLLTAASLLDDSPLSLATSGGEYAPQNYDHAHRGLVSVRTALGGSLNIPAVRTLALTGLEPFAARLSQFGFNGLTEAADFYGYALALGSLDVRLEELVNAYRALANGGLFVPLRFTPSDSKPRSHRVQSPESAFLIADILSDRQARAVTFGLENPLATRFWTAVKTGTSKDMRDNWCVGFSSRYTVGVWVGNFSGSPMHDVSGISGAAPAWAAIMERLHGDTPSHPPKRPRGLLSKLVQPQGETARLEWFLPGSEPPTATWSAASPPAQIVQPSDGAILALDPDIPRDRQRLQFQARNAPEGARWLLNDTLLDTPDWLLARGKHLLILKDRDGLERDRVQFEVR
jgi:penicillin-binding protein 1C